MNATDATKEGILRAIARIRKMVADDEEVSEEIVTTAVNVVTSLENAPINVAAAAEAEGHTDVVLVEAMTENVISVEDTDILRVIVPSRVEVVVVVAAAVAAEAKNATTVEKLDISLVNVLRAVWNKLNDVTTVNSRVI